ncbi:fruit body lectin [Annulohypoxylon moriforme]|nr:fruit body lectin [Annulohypoxylon moriforme]
MPFSIQARILRTNLSALFRIVEEGTWSHKQHKEWLRNGNMLEIRLPQSGRAAMLRFVSDSSSSNATESFGVVFGIHNQKRWVDIVTDIGPAETTAHILPTYYNNTDISRTRMREAQHDRWEAVTKYGKKVSANFTVSDGDNLQVDISIDAA